MIGVIARREIALQFRDGRLVLAGATLLIAMAAAILAGWAQYDRAERERAHFVAEARAQWLNQGERHPHRAAHFGAYVAKPELSLALFEPGLRPFAGQTLWLEAHDRPAFANIPSEDDLTLGTGLGVASGASILQILGGLLVLVMGALAIVRERESGVLRQVLAQGIGARTWVAGKFLGLAAVIAIPVGAAGLLATAGAAWASPAAERADVVLRALALLGADALLLGALLAIGLAVSAVAKSSRAALIGALAVWVGGFVLAPRAAATLCERLAPAPTLEAYQSAAGKIFGEGFDSRGGYDQQLKALEASTLRRYGVDQLSALPVGFSGLRMKHMDAWSTEVDDREYAKLERTYGRQTAIRATLSAAAPFIAARSVSQGMAGMDWAHHRHFLQAAEQYRRGFGLQMNTLLEQRVHGERWEMNGANVDWAKVSPFQYRTPSVGWAVGQQGVFIAILAGWAVFAAGLLALAARRLRP